MFAEGDDRALSYAELVAEAERWSAFYASRGLVGGDRVIVILPHSLDLYAAYLGALLGGQVPAMFSFPSPKFSEEEYFRNVGTLIETAHSRMLVAYPELAGKLEVDVQLVRPDDVIASGAVPEAAPDPQDVAFVQYSSGTTGIKKGVAVSHRALLWQIDSYAATIGAGRADRIVTWLPLYHDMGLITCFFLPLLRRIPVVAMSPFDWVRRPAMWTEAVQRHRATLSWLPNFAFSFMAANVRGEADLTSLRGVVNCSEPIMAASHEAFMRRFDLSERQLAVSYAMAENTFAVTSGFGAPTVSWVDGAVFDAEHRAQPAAAGGRPFVSSGRPLPEHELVIVDEHGKALGEREVGEIVLRSPCLMNGYDHNPEATERAMRDGRYHTGDLGFLADGELYVTGRSQDLIIVGGRNIYPQDIERVVEGVQGVVPGRVVAVGVPDPRLGTESLAVLAETTETDVGRREELRRAIHAAVSERTEVVPHVIRVLDHRSLLKSSSGKPARRANRERFLTAGDLLERVRDVVRAVSGEAIADDASLITAGLIDSMGIVELFTALQDATGVAVPQDLIGETDRFDSIAQIARTLELIRAGQSPAARAAGAPPEPDTIPMEFDTVRAPRRSTGLRTAWYRLLFRLKGVRCGPGLRVLGPILLQIDGDARNIEIGADVTLMPGAHLKNRENGRIVLHDGVKLDTMARLVAANDARIELGENVAIGLGTVINAGCDVLIGRGSLTAAHCVINASDHGIAAGVPIQRQPFEHGPILIGEDVWLGAGAFVNRDSRIGAGAVVSAGAAVTGTVPAGAIVHGRPARVVKHRS